MFLLFKIDYSPDFHYLPGQRSDEWLKIKSIESEEAIICGYTDSVKDGTPFGSLILGMYDDGQLVYKGNYGSGFSAEKQQELLKSFEPLQTDINLFGEKINLKGRVAHWLEPKLICEVKFTEWTTNGIMRHPVFKCLRDDKLPMEIDGSDKLDRPETHNDSSEIESTSSLDLNGKKVPITNLEKVYWPESGLRKYDLIDYYLAISESILPYLRDRPQNLHRHPNGIQGEGFYQKDNENLPAWIETFSIHSKSAARDIDYLLCQDEATLLYLANLGCIELNPWNSKIGSLENPDYTVIDLDPSEKNSFEEVIETAQALHELLEKAQLKGYCKTSGSRGLHIYLPLNAIYTYEEARDFTKLLCYYVREKLPKLTTMERALNKRDGKIYLDYLQNRKGQTLASAYCVRPRKDAPVSAPLQWKEVQSGLKITDHNLTTMPNRIKEMGDLFKPVLGESIDMAKAIDLLNAL